MSARQSSPKPWPMKWIVLAILLLIIPYTWLTLRYRKPGDAYLPYQDNKERAQVMRLLDAGYQRINLTIEQLAEAGFTRPPLPAATASRPGGLPPALSEVLLDHPRLPGVVTAVIAPAVAQRDAPYPIRFTCTQPAEGERVSNVQLYLQAREATLVPAFEPREANLQSREETTTAQVILPAGTLAAGTYRLTVVGARESRSWTVEVQ